MLPEFKDRFPNRQAQRKEAIEFVKALGMAPIERICIENPVGILSTVWRKPNQYIQPWQFGENAVKKTGLWLKNLPCLKPTQIVEPEYITYNSSTHKSGKSRYPVAWGSLKAIYANQTPSGQNNVTPSPDRWKIRSKTYQGIAEAMAEQWGEVTR